MSLIKNTLRKAAIAGCIAGASLMTAGAYAKDKAHELTIGMSFQDLNNSYFIVMKESLEQIGKELDAKIIITDARHDVSKQINDVEDMLQKDVDILLINPTDSIGIQSAVMSAKEAGVITIAIDAQAEGGVDGFVGSKNYDAGFKAGEYLAEAIGKKGEVAIIDGIPVVPILERVRGFEDAMKNYPNIKVVDKQNGKQQRSMTLTVTENMLQAHPNLAGIFSVNDDGTMGALAAVEASGQDVKFTSVDGHPEAIEAIQKGSHLIATSAQHPRDMVRIGVGLGLAKLWGANIPSETPINIDLIDHKNAGSFAW
ncbi:ABC transporter substrate-binding protein [Vibrio sp. dhg]|uniref:ABC transporter substrate-binding protein n=1 Tax=Vibrio sp. dhg TaxID=2163016 RepID=UPI000E48ABF6|nr:ABC transporter substrate-binding protein [Vibrio sp. dhg]AXT73768.1 LacI family transcriptional regulator [Vibrio sp. dhg]